MTKRLCIGEIATAHGVKGFVKVKFFGENPALLEEGPLFTEESGDETLTLTLKHSTGGAFVAEVDGIGDRDEALALRGTKLYITRDSLPDQPEGTYYHADLVGLKVQDPQGRLIGKILNVVNFGAGDMLEIQPTSGGSFYLPFLQSYVPKIDIKADIITADIPEGLR